MLYILLLIVFILLYLLNYLMWSNRKAKLVNKLQGPRYKPFIGNLLDVLGTPVHFFYMERNHAAKYMRYGISRFWLLHNPTVNIYEPKYLETILSSSKYIDKGKVYGLLHDWLKDGLLTSTGQKWQKRRKLLTPTFHFNILRQFCSIFIEKSEKLVDSLSKEDGKSETDIMPYITRFTLNSICETAMGTNLEAGGSMIDRYKEAIYGFGESFIHRSTRMWLHIRAIFNMTEYGKKYIRWLNDLHGFTNKVINERRQQRRLDRESVEASIEDTLGIKRRLAMLDLILKSEEAGDIDKAGVAEEVDTFMFEGHDTTTMGFTFLWMLLANHPDIQERIVSEINEIIPDIAEASIEDFGNLSYLEMCIKEALRLYPSVPIISRHLNEDLDLGDFIIPANSECDIHIFDIHRNPKYFPNPHKFDPDRFLLENVKNRHPYAYIPFSAGPRNCIGQKFAMLELKIATSYLLRNFRLEAVTRPEDIVFTMDLVLRPISSIKVKFIKKTISSK